MKEIDSILEVLEQGKSSLIFLGGIHGVGKTSLCNERFAPLGFHCVTASSLIKKYGVSIDKSKRVDDVDTNQTALVEQLNIEKSNHKNIVLDGHFCLINNNRDIEAVEESVFAAINPTILILMLDDTKTIYERLLDRDQNTWNSSFIEEFQNMEKQHAMSISKALCVPLHVIVSGKVINN